MGLLFGIQDRRLFLTCIVLELANSFFTLSLFLRYNYDRPSQARYSTWLGWSPCQKLNCNEVVHHSEVVYHSEVVHWDEVIPSW